MTTTSTPAAFSWVPLNIGNGAGAPLVQALRDLRSGIPGNVFGRGLDRRRGVARLGQVLALRVGCVLQPRTAARVRLTGEQRLREPFRAAERVGALQEFEDGIGPQFEGAVNDAVIARHDDGEVAIVA